MKKAKAVLIIVIIFAALAGVFANQYFRTRTLYNKENVIGNTGGNLYNSGLFCEQDGVIYFSNHDDNDALYSMDIYGQNLKKISKDTAKYINVDENYVYYVRCNNDSNTDFTFFSYNNNSLCRVPKNGGKVKILDPDPCSYALLVNNSIYYLHYDTKDATTLYKIGIDGKKKKKLTSGYIFPCSAYGTSFYYHEPDNGNLYEFDTLTDTTKVLYAGHCYKPIVDSNNAYFLDVDNKNRLSRLNLNSNTPAAITNENVELFNVSGSYVYYQRGGSNPALCMIKTDGSDYREIATGEYSDINVTSTYVYFKDFRTGDMYYTNALTPDGIYPYTVGTK